MGSFTARINRLPRFVDEELCTACGICSQYCPVPIPDPYNEKLSTTKALHIEYQQGIPSAYHVDAANCLFLTKQECKQCERVCQAKAIDFKQKAEDLELNVGAVILAPGFGRIDESVLARYGYGLSPDVVTGMEFERLTSVSGPSKGEIVRPSDGMHPQRIAFLQCIGTRDLSCGNGYCSSVCCMYAVKEALVAKEHEPDIDITIFYMDMRTQGKDFDAARIRAVEKGIHFVRSRVGSIQLKEGDLEILYVNEHGEHMREVFEMVVLPEGLESPADARVLAEATGIVLNQYNFCQTRLLTPLTSSREGIYVAGAFQGPKDVPDSVTDASGAAGLAAAALRDARGNQIETKTYAAEVVIDQEPRIGVFVCSCGKNVGGVVDVEEVAHYASALENVVFTDTNVYSCAQNTQEAISEKISVYRLNRVVVAACTPRTHEPLFQETLRNAGLNRCLFEMANIRDHCSWVHAQMPLEATAKAKDLVRMAVAKARGLEALPEERVPVIPRGLVIGGGLAGMTAALGIAEQGFECFLVEKTGHLGGNLKQLRFTLSGESPQQTLEELENRVRSNPLIRLYADTFIEEVTGYVGNFTTSIRTADGPAVLEHGVIVVATGGKPYDPVQYCYKESKRVVTQLELEEKLKQPEEAKKIHDIVMIQCVGSRGEDLAYCSKVCCGQAVKNSLQLLEINPEANITILYRDMRTYGFMEDFYQLARDKGVVFLQYDPENSPVVVEEEGRIKVSFFDNILADKVVLEPDLVVLSVGIVPSQVDQLAKTLKTPLTAEGFFLEAHPKLKPVEFPVQGIYLCGLAHSPKPMSEAIAQAKGAAGKACVPLARGYVTVEPIVSVVAQENCIGCGVCESLCPYAAIRIIRVDKKKKAETIAAACKGCGICASRCPTFCISMGGFTNEQILAQIKAFASN